MSKTKGSDQQDLLRKAVRDFTKKELSGIDDLNTMDHIPNELVKKIGDLGFFALNLPEQFGGEPGTWTEIGTIIEEIANTSVVIAHRTMINYQICLMLAEYGSNPSKESWLENLLDGTSTGCIALTEEDSGSDLYRMNSSALLDSNHYTINGRKCPISYGSRADMAIVFCRANDNKSKPRFGAFIVPLDLPGIRLEPINLMGLTPSSPVEMRIDQVKIPEEYRLGVEIGEDGILINKTFGLFSDISRVFTGLIAMGAAQNCIKLASGYARQRIAFGKPIVQFEAVSGLLAECATLIEAGKSLCYHTLALMDQQKAASKEASMCGLYCVRNAFDIVKNALLVYGHSGYSDDYPLQQILKDVTTLGLVSGSEQIMKLDIAEKMIGKMAVPETCVNR